MSADNYLLIVEGKDGVFRAYMQFASSEEEFLGNILFEAKDVKEAVLKAQQYAREEFVEYGYYFRFYKEE